MAQAHRMAGLGVTISVIHEVERYRLRAMLIPAIETAANHSCSRARELLEKFSQESPKMKE